MTVEKAATVSNSLKLRSKVVPAIQDASTDRGMTSRDTCTLLPAG